VSALTQALEASQSKAVAALGKAYVRRDETPDDEFFTAMLKKIGLDDAVAIHFLLAAWSVLREEKAAPPAEQTAPTAQAEPSTEAQRSFIDKLMDDAGQVRLDRADLERLSKDKASALISDLKAGTYDPAKWDVGF
jgi:hypothetical protein